MRAPVTIIWESTVCAIISYFHHVCATVPLAPTLVKNLENHGSNLVTQVTFLSQGSDILSRATLISPAPFVTCYVPVTPPCHFKELQMIMFLSIQS